MRKNSNQIRGHILPIIHSAIITQPLIQTISSLQKYQLQFPQTLSTQVINFKVTKPRIKRRHTNIQQTTFISGIKQVSNQISGLRKQIRSIRYSKDQETKKKIGKLLNQMQMDIYRNKSMPPSNFAPSPPPPPVYVPMPYPMYIPTLPQNGSTKTFYRSNRLKTGIRHYRGRNNIRKWRKVVHCILFYLYLKRFCKIAQSNRRVLFTKFMSTIKVRLNTIKKQIIETFKQFLSILLIKKDVSFDFDEEDDQDIIKQKRLSLRKLITILLENLLSYVKSNRSNVQLVESLYYLCRHGNYSCTQPLLTKQQLQITCISQQFKYISCDKYLEKSSILNLILLKLIIYNLFLLPQNLGQKYQQFEIPNNLYLIASILYQFCIDYQDQLLLLVNKTYAIGNYESVGKIRALQSIIIKQGTYREGEMISGLKDQNWIKQYFKFQNWNQEKQNLKNIIQILHQSIRKYHTQLIQKYY